jgi:hydroxypyruvate reductase
LCLFVANYVREIFEVALSAVDPRQAVSEAITFDISSRPVYAIAIGKAARSMALGLEDALGERLTATVISAGGHPLPNEASLASARVAFALLDRANAEQATVIFLISGGGSAMLEWPISDEISLSDLRAANQVLVTCGARIAEVNAVRRAFSAVKGGALAQRAPHAQLFTLIVSDTNRDDEASVASGPTLAPPSDAPKAREVVAQYHLEKLLPASILKAIHRAEDKSAPVTGSHQVLLGNWTALEAAAKKAEALRFHVAIAQDICEQPIELGCELLLSRLMSNREERFCLISGGEFSCPVRGDGRGGRNLETVLRCAISLDRKAVLLSAGTDGIDGNSPAAGAIADETTLARARSLGLDAHDFLARSDSYTFFEHTGDLVLTGPTGTNVRDIRIFLRSP